LAGSNVVDSQTATVSLDRITAAREVLRGVVRRTPVESLRVASESLGGDVYLKCENLQRTGSFKIRGGYLRIHGLTEEQRAHGVVAASAGNHAQGVALAASLLGARSTVFMPEQAPLPKVAATRGYGAEVRLSGATVEDALAEAKTYSEETGAEFLHPFEHPDIIAGQGTVGLEVCEQVPDVATILVATGGGGLLGGIAAAVKALRPGVRVVGVQAAQAAAFPASLASGAPRRVSSTQTLADGIAVAAPGELTLRHATELVDDIVTVSEESLSRAVLLCMERAKLVVEPAGAAAVAAMLEHPHAFETPVVGVLSGGNVDPLLLLQIIRHGMTAAGRFLSLQLRLADRPGALAGLLGLVGTLGANVVDVAHTRIDGALALGEVEVALTLETRGPEHRERLLATLADGGYTVL
jgi:threonine dehydratase